MSDPKNKWTQPGAPPAPMFFGENERNLVKQVNDELIERVIGQTIIYYPIDLETSNFHPLYGEAIEKNFDESFDKNVIIAFIKKSRLGILKSTSK